MDMSCSRDAGPARDPAPHPQKTWAAELRKPLGIPTDCPLSVQLPTGPYELSEHDDIHYALYASSAFSVILRLTEVEQLRSKGALVIDGVWP
jgi:hypothetical protein